MAQISQKEREDIEYAVAKVAVEIQFSRYAASDDLFDLADAILLAEKLLRSHKFPIDEYRKA